MSFQFEWWCSSVPKEFQKKLSTRFEEAGRAEIEYRARLFHNLGTPRDRAVRRIQDNVAWDFELSKIPAFAKEIPAIVDRVYQRKPR